ncbi:MAG: NifB/NifX family molybdenum-iron cluster-binding protein [Deltaproteobacteria bacterium]|nr:NifB/NifX family molybdenum-iron cluster-binding protein [Deltaproteobacteria bacterium]
MNICVPVTEDKGLESPISEHFGSAPLFVVCDTEGGTVRALTNRNQVHAHGMCQPLLSLQGEQIDGIVVGGIGMGAMMKFQAAGIRVFLTGPGTVGEAVSAWRAGTLREATPAMACGHHGQGGHGGGGCGHGGR